MSENILAVYDKVAPDISAVYDQQTHIIGIKNFIKLLPARAKILDLGCGPGRDVFLFNKFGYEAVGIDGSEGMVGQARKRFPKKTFIVMDVRDLKFPDETFDAVWSWSTLTHLGKVDKAIALREVCRVLKGGGLFTQMVWKGRGEFINKHVYPRPHFLLPVPSWRKLYVESGFTNFIVRNVKGIRRDFIRLTAKKI